MLMTSFFFFNLEKCIINIIFWPFTSFFFFYQKVSPPDILWSSVWPCNFLLFFKSKLYFLELLKVHRKRKGALTDISNIHSTPTHVWFNIMVHLRCGAFCEFEQMYNNVYLSLWYHTDYVYCPKNPCMLLLFITFLDLYPSSIVLLFQDDI